MASVAVWTKVEEESAVKALRDAGKQLDPANGDVTLDFSAVHQIDASVVRAMEDLAERAEQKGIKVILGGVNVDVYKVLKLVRLSGRFAFL